MLTLFPGNLNGSRFEVYALVAETYSSGAPIAYILIQSSASAEPGAKLRLIQQFLVNIRDVQRISPHFTGSDKDRTEISAFRTVFPAAKHQLCFWHCLRAVEKRLHILRHRPSHYNAALACAEFDFIDPNFLPVAQRNANAVII